MENTLMLGLVRSTEQGIKLTWPQPKDDDLYGNMAYPYSRPTGFHGNIVTVGWMPCWSSSLFLACQITTFLALPSI